MYKLPIIHPGMTLKEDFLIPMKISANTLAKSIGVSPSRIRNIIKGKQGITADTAIRLSKVFGTSPELWMNLQSAYDLKIAFAKNEEEYNNKDHLHFSKYSDFDQAKLSARLRKKFDKKLTYAERAYLLFQEIYETGMEYESLLLSKHRINFDAYKWYDDIIIVPEYMSEITSGEKKMLLKLNKLEMYKDIIKQANERDTQDYYENTELADIDVDIIDETESPKPTAREGWDKQFKRAKDEEGDDEEGNDF